MGCCMSDDSLPSINPNAVDMTHFDVMRVLGRGGFGKVNAVKNRLDGNMYALKSMPKSRLIKSRNDLEDAWIERDVMSQFRSNFLGHLYWAFQDERFVYLVMHFLPGGDLRYYLKRYKNMTEEQTRFYAVEILLALEEMHQHNLIYRDLKPENIMLDQYGHVRITDFGLVYELKMHENQVIWPQGESGTPNYMSPEMVEGKEYGFSHDVWSYGVVLYELLHGGMPFIGTHEILNLQQPYHHSLSGEVMDLLNGLLWRPIDQRLGCDPQLRWQQVKSHPWFAGIDWSAASRRELKPPYIPEAGVANCNNKYELEDQLLQPDRGAAIKDSEQQFFRGWEFNTDIFASNPSHLTSTSDQGLLTNGATASRSATSPRGTTMPTSSAATTPSSSSLHHTTTTTTGSTGTGGHGHHASSPEARPVAMSFGAATTVGPSSTATATTATQKTRGSGDHGKEEVELSSIHYAIPTGNSTTSVTAPSSTSSSSGESSPSSATKITVPAPLPAPPGVSPGNRTRIVQPSATTTATTATILQDDNGSHSDYDTSQGYRRALPARSLSPIHGGSAIIAAQAAAPSNPPPVGATVMDILTQAPRRSTPQSSVNRRARSSQQQRVSQPQVQTTNNSNGNETPFDGAVSFAG